MNKKFIFFIISFLIILPGTISLVKYGLNLGIDFSGGVLLEYKFEKTIEKDQLSTVITNSGLSVSSIAESGSNSYIIKAKHSEEGQIFEAQKKVEEKFGKVTVERVESVGPVIGSETTKNAVIAIILAAVMIVLYLAFSFRKVPRPTSPWRFGIVAVLALLHDVLVVVGVFSILGHYLGVEIDILFVSALLTIIGFSVHDTIVVFDRIRENLPKHLSKRFIEVANISIVQTLVRSLGTSLTVVFVLLALLLFGGESIKWFVVALLVGIISGTYSSIFNATALLVLWEEKLGH
ncbi:MAG: protein translocase subunit SecF [Candidatus Daviesbacteria bacterium]|nr:protein translocase subunit SecF [Candidatus Daviesbacteria bacterium]